MKLNRSILLLASSILIAAPAIAATDFNAMLKTFAGIVRNYDDLDSRRMQLQMEVDKALKAGQISAEEAASFKSDLAALEQREMQLKSSGRRFGFTQQLLFTNDISILTNRLSQAVAAKTGSAAVLTPQALEAAQAELANKISVAQNSGKLNQTDADKLKQDLKHVSDIKQAFLSSSPDGNLTAKQIELLNSELEKVRAAVEEQIKQTDSAVPQLNERRNKLQNKINDAENSKKISADLARQLRSELQQVADMQSSFLADGAMSGTEILKIASELDRMEARIDQAIQTSTVSVPVAQPPVVTAPPVNQSSGSLPMPSYNANKYTDIQSYWGAPYVAILGERGVIGGFPDGSFKPHDPITRSQFAAIAVRALGLPASSGPANFQDVPAKHWANSAIAAVSASGLVTGFPDGSFKPEDKITRTQALVILAKALPGSQADKAALNSFTDAAAVPAWAYASVLKAADSGIIVNYPDPNLIRSGENATRGEVAALMYRTLQNLGQNLPAVAVGLPQYVINRLAGNQQMPPTAPPVTGTLPSTSVPVTPPPPPPPPPPSPDKIYLFNVSVQAPAQARGGDVITVSAIGTPKGRANLTINGLLDKGPMTEVRDGVYEATYTVRRSDNVGAARVTVTLSKDTLAPVSMDYATPLNADAKEPEVSSVQPAAASIVSDRMSSIVATFNDGLGSGINRQSVKLIVNGNDVSSAATIGDGFVTFKPSQPFLTPKVDVDLQISDKAGNAGGQKWSFSFDKPPQ